MDPLRGEVFSPADGDYNARPMVKLKESRYCRVCRQETREAKVIRLFLGALIGYALAVAMWAIAGSPC